MGFAYIVPLESIALNMGQVATIETHGYPELLTTSLALRMTWTIRTGSQSRLRMDIQRFVTEVSHTLTIGTGLDATDESSIVFKVHVIINSLRHIVFVHVCVCACVCVSVSVCVCVCVFGHYSY